MSKCPLLFPETSNESEIHAPAYTAARFEPPALQVNPWAVAGICILALSASAMVGMLVTLWFMLP